MDVRKQTYPWWSLVDCAFAFCHERKTAPLRLQACTRWGGWNTSLFFWWRCWVRFLRGLCQPKDKDLQTIFDELNFKLEQLDSSSSSNWIPEPLEIFIGYNSPLEGVNSRILKIDKIEKFENSDVLFSVKVLYFK